MKSQLNIFFNTENSNYKNKHIRKLVTVDETVTTPSRILEDEKYFYKQLYTENCSSEGLVVIRINYLMISQGLVTKTLNTAKGLYP